VKETNYIQFHHHFFNILNLLQQFLLCYVLLQHFRRQTGFQNAMEEMQKWRSFYDWMSALGCVLSASLSKILDMLNIRL